ncbi:MAG: NifB/NifX family molybdenum-iron cluster-binding protein [Tissierellia bacterium]|nr:NifB/NifX family molybdenum-iron cluster-binding protein [Tissierellia bacterium]MDD4780555.1 NifB/NifX family molybdenum-iron cluster-binding protein [Tissierellia bacterium]
MKIMIPVDENSSQSKICVSFGRAPYFLIYDTDSDESKYIENTAAESQGGAGIKAAQIIVDNKADVLITPRCGENAAEVLNAANIKIYKSMNDSIQENLNAIKSGELSILNEIHEGFHGHHGGRR